MAPEPSMSATVNVSPGAMRTEGEIFQPWPRSRAQLAPVPSVAVPALPFSPVKFSALMERVFALDSSDRLPRFMPSPLNAMLPPVWEYGRVGVGAGFAARTHTLPLGQKP